MKLTLKILGIPLLFIGLWFVISMSIQTKGNMLNAHLDLPVMVDRYTESMNRQAETLEDFKNNITRIRETVDNTFTIRDTWFGKIPVLGNITNVIVEGVGGIIQLSMWIIQLFGQLVSSSFKIVIPTLEFLFNPIWITY